MHFFGGLGTGIEGQPSSRLPCKQSTRTCAILVEHLDDDAVVVPLEEGAAAAASNAGCARHPPLLLRGACGLGADSSAGDKLSNPDAAVPEETAEFSEAAETDGGTAGGGSGPAETVAARVVQISGGPGGRPGGGRAQGPWGACMPSQLPCPWG